MKRKKEEIVIITKEVTRYENCKNFSSKNTIYFFIFPESKNNPAIEIPLIPTLYDR